MISPDDVSVLVEAVRTVREDALVGDMIRDLITLAPRRTRSELSELLGLLAVRAYCAGALAEITKRGDLSWNRPPPIVPPPAPSLN